MILGLAVAEAGKTAFEPFQTTAIPHPDGGFVINGTKIYTTGAAEADLVAVWGFNPAAFDPDNPFLGLQLNLVPAGTAGVTVHRDWDALGQRATDSGTISFVDVRTDPAWRASEPGRAPLPHSGVRFRPASPPSTSGSASARCRRGAVRPRAEPAVDQCRRGTSGRRPPRPAQGWPPDRRPRRRPCPDDALRRAARRVRAGRGGTHRAGDPRLRRPVGRRPSSSRRDERDLLAHGNPISPSVERVRSLVAQRSHAVLARSGRVEARGDRPSRPDRVGPTSGIYT